MIAGFKAKNHPQQVGKRGADDGVDERITPADIFEDLNEVHGFTIDAAANAQNTKCAKFFTREQNGLGQPWHGETVWANPPYSDLNAWVTKAYWETRERGCPKVVMLLPANRCEQPFWQTYIEPYREIQGHGISTRFLRGRRRFGWPAGRVVPKKGDRPPFGLVVVIFEKP